VVDPGLAQERKGCLTSSVRSRASLGLKVGSASIMGCSSVFTRNRSLYTRDARQQPRRVCDAGGLGCKLRSGLFRS